MISSGERLDLSAVVGAHGRQALDRRGRRQGLADPRAAGRELRRRRAAAVRARPRPHRRHPGQAGVDPRLAGRSSRRRDGRGARLGRLRDLRGRAGPRPGRPQAVRAARRHRDRRVDPADRQLDHVQEDRRGHGRAGARRQGGQRRVHAGAAGGAGAGARPWSASARRQGCAPRALLTSMDAPLGRAVGNAVEVEEAVATLRGEGPPDLVEVTLALASEMLALAGVEADPAAALADGRALGPVPRDDRRPGRRPGCAAARGPAHRGASPPIEDRLAAAARRPRGRRGRLAARRRAGPQGGPT